MTSKMRRAALPLVLIAVGACSSGGGGGGSSSTVTFTSFGAIAPNQTVVMDATAITANVGATTDVNGNVTVTSVGFTPQGAGQVRLSYDGSRTLSAIDISTPQPNSSVSFNRSAAGHSISCGGGTCLALSPSGSAAAIDPFFVGWNYQTFGVWGIDTSPTTAVFGAISAGSPTLGSVLPLMGTAVFNGLTAGFYVDAAGTPFATASSMTANVDFGNQSVGFSTSDMTLVNVNSGAQSTRADLRLGGTLNYATGVNSFSGTLNTQNTQLSGTASGRFYGPAAQEIGGTYSLSGNGQSMIGGFGGKR